MSLRHFAGAALAAACLFPSTARAQGFSWDPSVPVRTVRPLTCIASIRQSDDADWTRGECSEVAFSVSEHSANIHFRVGSSGRNAIVTYVIDADHLGGSTLPVMAVGLGGTEVERNALDIDPHHDPAVNVCRQVGKSITCNAMVRIAGGRHGLFVNSATLP